MSTYVALGSNLKGRFGGRRDNLQRSLVALAREDVKIVACSPWYSSPAFPDPSEPEYINAVAAIETSLSADALLDILHAIEAEFGRIRRVKWEARVLDLDILDHRGEVRSPETSGLTLPHPRLESRDFALLPLRDVCPDWRHPVTGQSVSSLIEALETPITAKVIG